MTFKATINTGLAEVSTTDAEAVKLLTPGGHEIGGATAVYAFDSLHELVGKYCKPGTLRGNGHAFDMGLALGAVLENQLAVIARQDLDAGRAEAFRRERDEALAERGAARLELARVREDLNCARKQMEEARAEARALWGRLSAMQCSVRTYCPAAPAPAVTEDTPVTLGMLQELNDRGDVLWSARYGTDGTETTLGMPLYESEGTWFAAEEVAKRERPALTVSISAISASFVSSTEDRLRDLHRKLDRRGVSSSEALYLLQDYHYQVGELLKERPARGEAQVASAIADHLEAHGFPGSASHIRGVYQIPGRR